jgi:RNA polymerase sigma factor (sigma-70 family)
VTTELDLDALFRAQHTNVYAIAIRYCRNVHDAEDVVQDTFLEVARSGSQFSGLGPIGAWIAAIAVGKALMLLRRQRLRRTAQLMEEMAGDSVDYSTAIDLQLAMDALPKAWRRVLWLHDGEGRPHREVGRILDITVTCSKARLRRARARVRKSLVAA